MEPAAIPDTLLSVRAFTDGTTRPVYLDSASGKRYAFSDGAPVSGVRLLDAESNVPALVSTAPDGNSSQGCRGTGLVSDKRRRGLRPDPPRRSSPCSHRAACCPPACR
jgi:hypothetical protein